MRVLVTGGTGFIGRALIAALRRRGDAVAVLVRSADQARGRLGADYQLIATSVSDDVLRDAVSHADAIVNLSGAPVLPHRWSTSRKAVLVNSRIGLTTRLVSAIGAASPRPRVLISSSAVGYYGDQGNAVLGEDAPAGTGFLAELANAWESAALAGAATGVRVVCLRTGIVFGREGGALGSLRLPFTLGLGGALGSGSQYVPWVHLEDVVDIILRALDDTQITGPINVCAPEPCTNLTFTAALAQVLARPAFCRVPAAVLRLVLGEAAEALLGSQRARPERLSALGFSWQFPTLLAALRDIFDKDAVRITRVVTRPDMNGFDDESRSYLVRHPPAYELRTTTTVAAPLAETFDFFSRAENLGFLTPTAMRFELDGQAPTMAEGARITYRLRVDGLPIRWETRIARWLPNQRFIDVQESGPYACWWHEHAFHADGERTVMEDRVYYTPPFGPLGRLAHSIVIAPQLRRIFGYRHSVIRLLFGVGGTSMPTDTGHEVAGFSDILP